MPRKARQQVFLELRDAAIRAGETIAFPGTDWRWLAGEHWAVLGPNGGGKSLLARALAGALPVVRGELRFGFSAPPGRTHEDAVALVSFEQAHELGLDGQPAARWFTLEHADSPRVRDFLSRDRVEDINPFQVGGPPRRTPAAFARDRRRILGMLRIENLMSRDLLALSNGERRKILIARALLKKPRLLILDDPFAGLDAGSRRHFRQVIAGLIRRGGLHLLLITTRPDELPRGITHVLRVAACRVVSRGRARRTRGEPSPPRSARRTPRGTKSPPGEEVIRLEKVTVRYGRKEILRDVSWRVRRGENWAVLGPNGSGKTTLLSLVTGDNPQAYSNDVLVFGRRRGGESLWELRRRIGVVSPDEHLHCDGALSCGDAACPGLDDPEQDGPTPRQRNAARRELSKLGLGGLAQEAFGALSPGRQRLVLLARALAKRPDLLVLDEPCQGLDARHRRRFLRAVEGEMARSRTPVLYVTHHLDELPRGLSHVLRLREGRAHPAPLRPREAPPS